MDAFVCLEAIACAEVAEVLSRNNVRDKVVIAMDAGDRTLDWIQKGSDPGNHRPAAFNDGLYRNENAC